MLNLNLFTNNKNKYTILLNQGEDLLVSLDKFVKKHKISPKNIRCVFCDTAQEKSIISIRIAQAILKALKIARE